VKSKAITQYLSRHAEPEAAAVASSTALAGSFDQVLVVPAYNEGQSLFDLLGSVPEGPGGEVLIVVVLNAREDSPPAVHEANAAARSRLTAAGPARVLAGSSPITEVTVARGRLLILDRAQPGHFLPEGQGVGLARKIGNDVALALFAGGRIASGWLHNTDADTLLPNDYFDQTAKIPEGGEAAAVYFFEHRFAADPTLAEAARLYEISLRYYTLGLAWAGSPYAYEAMGSCIAVRPEAYAAVRGFPRKNAAEDFYVLNKLAKVGSILRLAGSPLQLEGRASDRVPFGTGRAVSDLVTKRRALAGFRLYHPTVFAHLAAWLRVLERTARSGGRMDAALSELPRDNPFFRTDLLVAALEKMKAFPALREAIERSSGDPATMLRHFHGWFDAFRTLKLVHALRDGGLKSPGYREALAEAPFANLSGSTDDDPEILRRSLAGEERKLAASPAGWAGVEELPDSVN
jgi:hypothetical protein